MNRGHVATLPLISFSQSSFPQTGSALLLAALALLLAVAGCGPERSEVALPPGVAASAEETQPLAVGAAIPDVELQDADGRPVRPAALLEQGPIALVFYRGGW